MIVEDETGREIDLRDDDREPEPPDDDQQPLDLDAVATRLGRVSAARDLDLIAGVERLRERLAAVEAMPTEHRYVVITAANPDPDDPVTEEVSAEAAIREAASWEGGRALHRTVHLGPWQDLAELADVPPF